MNLMRNAKPLFILIQNKERNSLNRGVLETEKILKSRFEEVFQRHIGAILPLSSSVYGKFFKGPSKAGSKGILLLAALYVFPMSSMLSLYFFCLNLS